MEVILLENVINLGKIGDKVVVANGFGRNFLLKKGKALRFNKENQELVKIGCNELITKFNKVIALVDNDDLEINKSENTNDNSYDIILYNEDYTIGKVIEYILYKKFFEDKKNKKISYCGFVKKHPHDSYSTIRIIYDNDVNDTFIKNDIKIVCLNAIELYEKIKNLFI